MLHAPECKCNITLQCTISRREILYFLFSNLESDPLLLCLNLFPTCVNFKTENSMFFTFINSYFLLFSLLHRVILGGGVIKHHVCNANLMRNGADFSVFINTGQVI